MREFSEGIFLVLFLDADAWSLKLSVLVAVFVLVLFIPNEVPAYVLVQ